MIVGSLKADIGELERPLNLNLALDFREASQTVYRAHPPPAKKPLAPK
jgi:hypothetical protein